MFTGKTAAVCLFVYNRPKAMQLTIDALRRNELAYSTDLYVFSDGPADDRDLAEVSSVRKLIENIKGFRSVNLRLSPLNKGLACSIIDGVTEVIQKEGKVIVLEDDLLLASNFLSFMNAALDFYEGRARVFSVSGYSSPLKGHHGEDVYFTRRASSWGWATWKDRWDKVDWDVQSFANFSQDKRSQKEFNKMGSDLSGMLKRQMSGKINSWAIRWTYHQFRNDLYTVFPTQSKVSNEGFGGGATHTAKHNRSRFFTNLDRSGQHDFRFPDNAWLDPVLIRQFTGPYSLRTRAWYKLKGIFSPQ